MCIHLQLELVGLPSEESFGDASAASPAVLTDTILDSLLAGIRNSALRLHIDSVDYLGASKVNKDSVVVDVVCDVHQVLSCVACQAFYVPLEPNFNGVADIHELQNASFADCEKKQLLRPTSENDSRSSRNF